MKNKVVLIVVSILFSTALLFAGGEQETASSSGFKIGVSNGQITNTWRTQMVADLNQQFNYYKGMGVADTLTIVHAGSDVDLQISHIRNFIYSDYDLILVNPLSSTALNPVLEEAKDMGVLVIVFDQEITSPDVLQVVPDQRAFIRSISQYVIDQIGGKGKVVYVSGFDGQPANTLRDGVVYGIVDEYPDLEIITKINGNWDPTTAQQGMADVLSAFPSFDGVISQDGMQEGIIRAFENSNRDLVPITGDSTISFLKKWIELRDSNGFETLAYINGPGFTANLAMGVGIRILQGKELKDGLLSGENNQVLSIELMPITNDNIDDLYAEHMSKRGNADFIDGWYTEEEIDALFK